MYHVIPIKVPLKRKDIRQPKIRRNVIPTEVRNQTNIPSPILRVGHKNDFFIKIGDVVAGK